ncbi:peptidyl-tRNA hydrolase [Scheffersomyces amazonensis]|uniref:peptidyl-tRNA hydrolase n=1 Tax=Scheffersomyces amazonensis TaxID=1078765 RepID=UPI00315D3B57
MFLKHLYKSAFVPRGITPQYTSIRSLFIASIGNPEPEYEGTRHNVGHRLMDQLINIYWKDQLEKVGEDYYRLKRTPHVVLYKSNDSFMNLQGYAIVKHYQQFRNQGSEILFLHDDVQVQLGKYQFRRPTRSHRGHNGLKSIEMYMGNAYRNIAIGIGRPQDTKLALSEYVLEKFTEKELEIIDFDVLPKCVKELETYLVGEPTPLK